MKIHLTRDECMFSVKRPTNDNMNLSVMRIKKIRKAT